MRRAVLNAGNPIGRPASRRRPLTAALPAIEPGPAADPRGWYLRLVPAR